LNRSIAPGVWTRLGVRFVRATLVVDRAYALADRVRSRLVLAVASSRWLDAYSSDVYGQMAASWARQPPSLYLWEDDALSRFFPSPPARLLVGAAGAGREALALASRGYGVVAFEPCERLRERLEHRAEAADSSPRIRVFHASYADLPDLTGPDGARFRLRDVGPFDGAILGWGSFSHIRTDQERLDVLRHVVAVTRGPILVSFNVQHDGPTARQDPGIVHRVKRLVRGSDADRFLMSVGYTHVFTRDELDGLVERAGLTMAHFSTTDAWPHAVLMPRSPNRA
jgi:hypothetical protein